MVASLVCARARVRAHALACMHACVHACVPSRMIKWKSAERMPALKLTSESCGLPMLPGRVAECLELQI